MRIASVFLLVTGVSVFIVTDVFTGFVQEEDDGEDVVYLC